MGLKETCKFCGVTNIPIRLNARVVGSATKMKIWQCRECKGLWSEN